MVAGSCKKVYWKCKDCGYVGKVRILDRSRYGCSECIKELKTSYPEQAVSFYLEKHFPDTENGNWTVLGGKELDIYIPSIPAALCRERNSACPHPRGKMPSYGRYAVSESYFLRPKE